MLSCQYTSNSAAGETSPSSFVTDLRCVCFVELNEREMSHQWPAACLSHTHTHQRPACLVRFSTDVCVLVSVCDLIDDISLCCVGVIVYVCVVL